MNCESHGFYTCIWFYICANENNEPHLNRLAGWFFSIDGSRGITGAPIKRSGLSGCAVCLFSMAGNGDIDQSELEDELPGDRSL